MKKRFLSVLLSVAMVTGLIAGCGSSAGQAGTSSGDGSAVLGETKTDGERQSSLRFSVRIH